MQASCLSSLFSVLQGKQKIECCVVYDDDRQRVEEPLTLWYQMLGTRSSVRKYKQHLLWRRTCVWKWARYRETERERERERHKKALYFSIAIVTIITTTNLTKGYKVTLYSDYLRATAVYAIYRNSANMGCPKGQCEYSHYTLIFDRHKLWKSA